MRSRAFRITRWILFRSLGATLLIGSLPIPTDRMSVDAFALSENEETVLVHGLPWFFFVTDPTVPQPSSAVLISHFLLDWALAFALFALPVVLLMCIRLAALYAARWVCIASIQWGKRLTK